MLLSQFPPISMTPRDRPSKMLESLLVSMSSESSTNPLLLPLPTDSTRRKDLLSVMFSSMIWEEELSNKKSRASSTSAPVCAAYDESLDALTEDVTESKEDLVTSQSQHSMIHPQTLYQRRYPALMTYRVKVLSQNIDLFMILFDKTGKFVSL